MRLEMVKGKIHRATVTHADPHLAEIAGPARRTAATGT
jgi:aspartate 1-decarboxylase